MLDAWSLREVPTRAPPLPWFVALGLAVLFAGIGRVDLRAGIVGRVPLLFTHWRARSDTCS